MRERFVHSSSGVTSVTRLFVVTAALEVGAGVTLLVAPAAVIRLLFGPAVDLFPAASVARLTGAALLSLGAGCWWARHDGSSTAAQALLGAVLIYNTAVVALALSGALGALGPLLWAVVVLHGVQTIWCAKVIVDRRR